MENVKTLTKAQQTKAEIAAAAAIVAVEGTDSVKVMGETLKYETIGAGNTTGIADLTVYKNLKNKSLAQSFSAIEDFKLKVRLSVIGIGGELARINYTKSYKDDFPKMTFSKFCTDVIGLPKATAYRYIGVFSMCADATGKVNPEIARLSDAQLRALYAAGASYAEAAEIAAQINSNTSADSIKQLVADTKSQIETETAETEETAETAETAETEETEETAEKTVTFKGTLRGQSPLKVPEKLLENRKSVYAYLQEKQPHKLEKGATLYDVILGTVVDYIIVHDEKMNSVLTFYYQHGTYNIKDGDNK